jgi:type I restriction enzyme S subunit
MSDREGEAPQLALPDGWSLRRVRDLTSVVSTSGCKVKLKEYLTEGELAVVDQGHLLVGGFTDDTSKQVRTALPVIVFGDHTRRVKLVDFPFAAGADGTKVLSPGTEVLPRLLYHLLQAIHLPDRGYGRHYQFLANSEIPVPPIPEQQRLVEKIERLLGQSRTAREALDRIPPLLKRFRQAVLAKAFRGELTERDSKDEPASVLLERIREERRRKWEEDLRARGKGPRKAKYVEPEPPDTRGMPELPEGWAWVNWRTLSEWITYGFTRPMPHVEQGIPVVTAKNIIDGQIDMENTHKTTQSAFLDLSDKDRPVAGDLLLTKDGTIGRAAVVPPGVTFCINQSVAVVMLRSCPLPRSYLLYAVEAPFTQRAVAELAKGVALQHLSITDFGQLSLPLAPLPEQLRLVDRVQSAFTYADQVREAVDRVMLRTDQLDQAVLTRAFRGEL